MSFRPLCAAGAFCYTLASLPQLKGSFVSQAFNDRSPELHKRVMDAAERMRPFTHVNSGMVKFKQDREGVKLYTLKGNAVPGGVGVARVAEVEINAPIDNVAEMWWFHGSRVQWDTLNTQHSQLVREIDPDTRLFYIKGKPKPMISARDFGFTMCRVPASLVRHPFNARVFIQLDSASDVPLDTQCVRGNTYSMIILTPVTAARTKVTYMIDIAANGWIPTYALEMAGDDVPMVIGMLKKALEAEASQEEASDVQTAARVRMEYTSKIHAQKGASSVVDDITATRQDLEEVIRICERRLQDLKREERSAGYTSDDLRKRIESDLSHARARLRDMSR